MCIAVKQKHNQFSNPLPVVLLCLRNVTGKSKNNTVQNMVNVKDNCSCKKKKKFFFYLPLYFFNPRWLKNKVIKKSIFFYIQLKYMINPLKVSCRSRQCTINIHVKHNLLPQKVTNKCTATHFEAPSSWSLDSCKEDGKLDIPPNLKNNGNISDPSPPADSHKSFKFRWWQMPFSFAYNSDVLCSHLEKKANIWHIHLT